jgi:predicted ester cyclase
MATVDLGAIVRQAFDAFNSKDLDRLASYGHPDARLINVPFGAKLGFREDAEMWLKAFSDAKCEVTNVVAQGDTVVAEFTGRGTHDGPLKGPTGDIPATGRRAEVQCIQVYRFRGEKIAECRLYFDAATMLAQLGLGAGAPAQGRPAAAPQPRH